MIKASLLPLPNLGEFPLWITIHLPPPPSENLHGEWLSLMCAGVLLWDRLKKEQKVGEHL